MKIKEIRFSPAFDKRHPDPEKNYGVHGVEIRWLYGDTDNLVVQFLIFTPWHLPSVDKSTWERWMLEPVAADLGYHSKKPMYEGQRKSSCDLLSCGFCYYDGSGLNAEPVLKLLIEKGDKAVWKYLEKYHQELEESPK